jgi:SAM-dependent methyltransferase
VTESLPAHDAARLRETFDQAAMDYDAARPGYPDALIDDIVNISILAPDDAILEVGCGTGQARAPFARRGHPMVCLDIGANLLAVARVNLREYPNARFVHAAFEAWDPVGRRFSLALSATAFHWIPPDVRYTKAASVLAEGGHLAVVASHHPRPHTEFFERVQDVYRRVVPEWDDPREGPTDEERAMAAAVEMAEAGLFEEIETRRYRWTVDFTAERYLRLLNTFSGHRALPDDVRRELFDGISRLIRDEFRGAILRPYLTVLCIGRKRA